MKKLRLLLGGSPCTFWSIAQSSGKRETEPSGLGWELFKNYLIAKEKFKPHYFLYENNVSASKAIKEQIKKELGVWNGSLLMPDTGVRYIEINSALVSAQNRKRFYVHNIPEVGQPEDKGVFLKDILEFGIPFSKDKSHCIDAKTGLYATPIQPACVAQRGRYTGHNGEIEQNYEARQDGKTNVITTVTKDNLVAVPIQGGGMGATTGLYAVPITYPIRKNSDVCITDKSIRCVQRDKKKSSVAESFCYFDDVKCGALTTAHIPMTIQAINFVDGQTYPVYIVKSGLITINGKQYPIKLPDGYYIIRKLTVLECKRLQTVRDDYIFPVSNTQAYKMLGNGWTVDVIAHILSHIPNLQDYELEVLSLYDGMSCGNLALEKLGCKIARYVSYEIDKWAIKTTQANFPFVEQRGDAFQIREHDWKY